MDVVLLWFQCNNPKCNYIPVKTKEDKVRYWREGKSITEGARPRTFARYTEGNYRRMYNGDVTVFDCKYGTIVLFDMQELMPESFNSNVYPIKDKEMCNQCLQRIKNEGVLFQ